MKKLLLGMVCLLSFTFMYGQSTLYLTTSGGSFTSEKWVDITTGPDGTGTVLWAQGDGTYGNGAGLVSDEPITIMDGTTYYINCYDKFDDSWDGTTYSLRSAAGGAGILVANNGGASPTDGNDEDSSSAFEDRDTERESSEMFSYTPPACAPGAGTAEVGSCDPANGIMINVNVTDLGDGTIVIQNDGGVADVTVTSTGTTMLGPFAFSSTVTVTLAHPTDAVCNVVLPAITLASGCPPANDVCTGAVPIIPSPAGTGCTSAGFTLNFSSDNTTDSSLDGSCNNTDTGLDQFFTWTATSAGLIFNSNSTTGNPGIVIRSNDGSTASPMCGAEIACASTFANNVTLNGWNIGDELIIQIYDYDGPISDVAFCLEEEAACADPTGFSATNITENTADISWTSASGCSGEEYWVLPTGSAAPTIGSGTTVACGGGITAMSLTGETTYDVWVFTVCSAGNTGPNNLGNFTTLAPPPVNDDCAGAIDLATETSPLAGNSCSATNSFPSLSCLTNSSAQDMIYKVDVPNGATLTIQQTSNSYDSKHRLAYGASCPGDMEIACTDDPDTNIESWTNTTGSTQTVYWVQSAYATGCGDFTLQWSVSACPAANSLVASDVTDSSASLAWTSTGTCNTDEYWILPAGSAAPTTSGVTAACNGGVAVTGLTAETEYDVWVNTNCAVGSSGPTNIGSFTTKGLPPSNDDCSGATPLTINADLACGTTTPGTIANATESSEDATACFGTENDDVWYSFVATNDTHVIELQNVAGSTTDLYHSIWEGTCGSLSHLGTCSDPNTSTQSGLTVGNTYYLRVNSWTSSTGQNTTFDVCVGTPPPPPSNNECSGATPISIGSTVSQDISLATSVGAPTAACSGGGGSTNDPTTVCNGGSGTVDVTAGGVWYVITSTQEEEITVDLSGSSFDTEVQVFEGSCGSLTCIGGDDDSGTDLPGASTFTSKFCFVSTASADNFAPVNYYVYIDGNSSSTGTIQLAVGQAALPVKLDKFSAKQDGRMNKVEWTTVSEINVDHHTVMKSNDGINWTDMTQVDGQVSSTNTLEYSVMDQLPYPTTYYKLKMTDLDGSIDYSAIVSVTRDNEGLSSFLGASPVPTADKVSLNIFSQADDNIKITLMDLSGKVIQSFNRNITEGNHQISVDLQDYQSGVYIVNLKSDYIQETTRVIKQ